MDSVYERSYELNVSQECDVFIAGGGIAGISAALAAARQGQKVILCEKQCALGGLATVGIVTVYLPLCDGDGNWVIHGIAEELFRLSIRYGADTTRFPYPSAWLDPENNNHHDEKKRLEVQFHPYLFAIACERLLLDEGVTIMLDTRIESAITQGKLLTHVVLSNKSGRFAIAANSFVDASGDADLCLFAGESTVVNPKNALAAWNYTVGKDGLRCNIISDPFDPFTMKDTDPCYDGTKGEDVTAILLDGHQRILDYVLKMRKEKDDETIVPVTIPLIPSFRMTRRLDGAYTLDESEERKTFEDSIGMITDWRKKGPVFNVPYRSLYGNKISNLITAGRIISTTQAMWDITRSIPCCAVSGEAAGVAAAVRNKSAASSFAETSVVEIQRILSENGVLMNCDFDTIQK